jgi:hypothetical protein
LPKCPICGKVLKNPDSTVHINSKYHQEQLKRKNDLKPTVSKADKKEEKTIALKQQLRDNLLDEEVYIKIAELEAIDINTDQIENLIVEFLNEEDYKFRFENLEEFFSIFNTLKNIVSFENTITKLDHFDQEELKEQLSSTLFEIDPEYFSTTDYGFDLVVKLISRYLGRDVLVQFLLEFEDLEDAISQSYYETSDAPFNPTLVEIEHTLSAALKSESQEVYNDALSVINSSGLFFEHLKKQLLNTFRVNKYIKLKLVGNRTNIYVNDQLFNQCKYLLIEIPRARMGDYADIDSIDEVTESLDRSMEGHEGMYRGISPETEFWGHCSNLQAWAENNYDTRILHRNLAFPLLKRLTEVGDPNAKKVFKQELVKRIGSGYSTVIEYLSAGGYFQYLSGPDIDNILDSVLSSSVEYGRYTPKRDLLNRFANMGSQRAKQLLSGITLEELKTQNLTTIQFLLSQNYYRHLDSSQINAIFPSIKNKLLESDNIDLKLSILKTLADYGVIKARSPLRKTILEKVKNANLTQIQQMFTSRYFNYLGKQELATVFSDLDLESANVHNLPVLTHFADLKVKSASSSLKTAITKLLDTKDFGVISRVASQNYLKYLSKQELDTIFNSISSTIVKSQGIMALPILKTFTDFNTKRAKSVLKRQIKQKIKTLGNYEIEQIIHKGYLTYLTENERQSTFAQMDYKRLFDQNFTRAIRLLDILKRKGVKNAQSILESQIGEILKHPKAHTIGHVLSKTYLNYFTEEELTELINRKDSELIEKSFEIVLAPSTRYNLRNKIVRFLKDIRLRSTENINQKIVNSLRRANLETFCNFVRAKLLDLLTTEEKDSLLRDPKCLLRQFIVNFNGKEVKVDYKLGLNLSNKGITNLATIKGLNGLTQLNMLDLRNNQLTNISGIGNLKNLKKLRIRGNPLPNQLIDHLGGLDRYGNAQDPQKFVEYSCRVEAGEVTTIEIDGSKIEVYSDELSLRNKGIKAISEIKGFPNIKRLKKLDLSHNQLESIEGIERFTTLKILNLSHNNLKDTTGIEKLIDLEELRLYGNDIQEFKERGKLKKLKVLDLDTRRKVDDRTFLNYLLQSLSVEDVKQVCRDFDIRGFSRYSRSPLINFTLHSLSEEEVREVISHLELSIISKGIDLAIKKISYMDREYIESIRVVNKRNHEIELKFKGFNWETGSYVAINPTTLVDPERDCDCRIGANNGLCSHFWIGFIYSLKAGYFKLSEWTLTLLPPDIKKKLQLIKLITTESGEKRLINEQADNTFIIENLNSKVSIHEAELSQFDRRQYTWEFKIVTYYLNMVKNVKISTSNKPEDIKEITSLLVRFSENMYNTHNLERCKKVQFTGQIHNDPYLGLMVKNVIVQNAYTDKKEEPKKRPEVKVKKEEEKGFPINFNEISDDLSGTWWHHISSSSFLFTETPPQIEAYKVQPDDILIHKEILLGDRFPSVRYHVVTETSTQRMDNYNVKALLVKKLVEYVKEHDRLPSNCRVVKEFKNKSVQINFNPSKSVNFALKVVAKTHDIADPVSFFKKVKSEASPMTEVTPTSRQTEPSAVNQWSIQSSSNPDKIYQVTLHPTGNWSCTCPHFIYRKIECKHIYEVKRRQNYQIQRIQLEYAIPVENCEDEEYLQELSDLDSIIITDENIFIEFKYPLSKEVLIRYQKQGGFTKRDILKFVGEGYKKIYEEEEASAGDPGTYDNLYNRRRSHGKYGIWGHHIEDLVVENLRYNPATKILQLFVGS